MLLVGLCEWKITSTLVFSICVHPILTTMCTNVLRTPQIKMHKNIQPRPEIRHSLYIRKESVVTMKKFCEYFGEFANSSSENSRNTSFLHRQV